MIGRSWLLSPPNVNPARRRGRKPRAADGDRGERDAAATPAVPGPTYQRLHLSTSGPRCCCAGTLPQETSSLLRAQVRQVEDLGDEVVEAHSCGLDRAGQGARVGQAGDGVELEHPHVVVGVQDRVDAGEPSAAECLVTAERDVDDRLRDVRGRSAGARRSVAPGV